MKNSSNKLTNDSIVYCLVSLLILFYKFTNLAIYLINPSQTKPIL